MGTSIEKQFFKFYEFGGLVDNCIDYLELKYNLNPYSTRQRQLTGRWAKYYNEDLPAKIVTEYEANKFWFDDMVARAASPLIDEIESNLNECKTDIERERYIFSLITPFAKLSGIIHPIAEIERLEHDILDLGKEAEMWRKANPDEQLKNTAGNAVGTPKEQLAACNNEIDSRGRQIDRLKETSSAFHDLLCCNVFEDGTVEHCLGAMFGTMIHYSDRLYAMLIQHGIDLKEYQRKAGIYLKHYWLITDIYFYVGSMELAKYYLDKIGHDEQPPLPAQPLIDGQPRPDERPDNSHFNAPYTKDELTTIFERLKNGRYLPADSVLGDWLIVCGADTTNEPTTPLNWLKQQNLLGWLVYSMFPNDKANYWSITANCFRVKGKAPNANTMKNAVSRVSGNYKDKPKAFEDLESLLKV